MGLCQSGLVQDELPAGNLDYRQAVFSNAGVELSYNLYFDGYAIRQDRDGLVFSLGLHLEINVHDFRRCDYRTGGWLYSFRQQEDCRIDPLRYSGFEADFVSVCWELALAGYM